MFVLRRQPKSRRRAACPLRLEHLEDRLALSRLNFAANPAGTGFPHPTESDRGWGGGSSQWEIVDNREDYPEWYHGLAFTGGPPPYVEPAGVRQVTINFGTPRTFQQIVVWHHGLLHIPTTNDPQAVGLQFWDGDSWEAISFTRSLNLNDQGCGHSTTPDYFTFNPVTSSKVRYWFDNRRASAAGPQNEHGWIYEFQVWNEPAPRNLAVAKQTCFNRAADQDATGLAVVNMGSEFAVHLTGNSAEQNGDGLVVSNRVALNLSSVTPTWNRLWPNAAGGDNLFGVAATTDAVFAAGSSWSRTVDTVGDKENKGITARFAPADGAETWARQTPAAPGAFPYGGSEYLYDVTMAVEGSQTFLYATGHSQSGFYNGGRVYVTKLDTAGNILWTRTDSVADPFSTGAKIAAHGGNVYVAGLSDDGGARRAHLKKYDASGNLSWARTSVPGSFKGLFVDGAGGALYAVGRTAEGATSNFLVEKWDLAGTRLWSQTFDRANLEDALDGVVLASGRLFAVGSTRGGTSGGTDAIILELHPATGALVNTTVWGGTNDDAFQAVAATPTGLHVAATTASMSAVGKDLVYLIFTLGSAGCDLTVSSTSDSGPGSLRQAVVCANSNPGPDTIRFAIGTGAQTINLQTPLPSLTSPVLFDGTSQPGYAGSPLIVLNGVTGATWLTHASSSGTTTLDAVVVNNPGTIQVQSGVLRLAGGGTSSGTVSVAAQAETQFASRAYTVSGEITLPAGATLRFQEAAHTLNPASRVAGAGTVAFSDGGTTTVAGAYDVGNTSVVGATANFSSSATARTGLLHVGYGTSGGVLGGWGDVAVSGLFTWSGGGAPANATTLAGTGRLIAWGGMNLIDAGTKVLAGRTVNNHGTATWNAGPVEIRDGATFNNLVDATFDVRTDSDLTGQGGPPGRFNNLEGAVVRKSAGAGTQRFGAALNNRGLLYVQTGTLRLSGGGTHTGTFLTADSTALDFAGQRHTLAFGAGVGGTGTVVVSAGTTLLDGAWLGGTLVDILSGGTLSGWGSIVANVRNAGRLDVGGTRLAGAFGIIGNYQQTASGVLNIDIGGREPISEHDFLYIDGTATLGGTLNLTRIDGFRPAVDDFLSFFHATRGTTGDFAAIHGLDLGDGLAFLPISDGYNYYLWTYAR